MAGRPAYNTLGETLIRTPTAYGMARRSSGKLIIWARFTDTETKTFAVILTAISSQASLELNVRLFV